MRGRCRGDHKQGGKTHLRHFKSPLRPTVRDSGWPASQISRPARGVDTPDVLPRSLGQPNATPLMLLSRLTSPSPHTSGAQMATGARVFAPRRSRPYQCSHRCYGMSTIHPMDSQKPLTGVARVEKGRDTRPITSAP